jgi:hypothetical protein
MNVSVKEYLLIAIWKSFELKEHCPKIKKSYLSN